MTRPFLYTSGQFFSYRYSLRQAPDIFFFLLNTVTHAYQHGTQLIKPYHITVRSLFLTLLEHIFKLVCYLYYPCIAYLSFFDTLVYLSVAVAKNHLTLYVITV